MPETGEVVAKLADSIWVVFQDSKGNDWFGSDGHGLYRFDGTTITRFTTQHGLCGDRIRGIHQHASGDLLITTLEGVSKFDGQRFVTLPVREMTSPDEGWVLNPDDVWLAWLPGQRGPYRYDGESLYHLKFPKHRLEDEHAATFANASYSPYEVYSVYTDRRGHMWFGTSNFGICRFDGTHLDWMYENHLTEVEGGGWFGIRSIIEDQRGAFWFCNTQFRYRIEPNTSPERGNGLIKYTREKGMDLSRTVLDEKFFYFMSIVEDAHGHLWMATYGDGVWRFDGEEVKRYPVRDGDRDVPLLSIYKDQHGGLWLGTQDAGAYRFDGEVFVKFLPPAKVETEPQMDTDKRDVSRPK